MRPADAAGGARARMLAPTVTGTLLLLQSPQVVIL